MMSAIRLAPPAVAATAATIFEAQRETALRLRTSTAAERVAKIRKLREAVLGNREVWYAAGAADFKKPRGEVDLGEIIPVALEANDAISNLSRWMRPKGVWPTLLMAGTSSSVQFQPRGRCLIISPWNYPLNLTFSPLISAIAAGNTVIIKPSELTPHFSAAMAKLVAEVFSPDEVTVIEGDATAAQQLLDLPFDHIFFTGSPTIGKVVMAAAAKHLTSVTLELGGKSPTIIDASADLDLAASNLMFGKFANAGQTCIAPDHLYVHESVKDAFVAKARANIQKAYGDDDVAQMASPYFARIVNTRHLTRVKALLDDARARGARVLAGGTVSEPACYVAPTLLDNVGPDAKIMQEEIFGPLLPIIAFKELDDVIARINAAPKPLALYFFGRDQANIDKVLAQTSSGGACVNHSLFHFFQRHLPFGGVNNSGMGKATGHDGFLGFSHERAILRTKLSLAATLFKAGEVPVPLLAVMNRFVRWL